MTLEQRVEVLEKTMAAYISKMNNDKFYNDADKAALRQSESELSASTDKSIAELEQAICDLSEEIGE